jgi:hypothetical protein
MVLPLDWPRQSQAVTAKWRQATSITISRLRRITFGADEAALLGRRQLETGPADPCGILKSAFAEQWTDDGAQPNATSLTRPRKTDAR